MYPRQHWENIIRLVNKHQPDFLIFNYSLLEKNIRINLNSLFNSELNTKFIVVHNEPIPEYITAQCISSINIKSEELDIKNALKKSLIVDNKNEVKVSSSLSDREKTVVRCVSLGMTNKEIADSLFLSAHTVIAHRKNITKKLGIKTVSGLTVYAIINKLVKFEEIEKF